jgi:hypothetical protein
MMRLNPRKGNKNKGQQTPPAAAAAAAAAATGGPGAVAVASVTPAVGVKVCQYCAARKVEQFAWSTISHSFFLRC